MSEYLTVVEEARELRDNAYREYVRAIVRASDAGHSLREIEAASGMTFGGIRKLLKRERSTT